MGVVGGIVEKEVFIYVFNVVIVNLVMGKVDCVGFCFEDEKKVCFFKFNGEFV